MTRKEWNQQYVAAVCRLLNDHTPEAIAIARASADASEDYQDVDHYNDPELAAIEELFSYWDNDEVDMPD